MLELILYFFNGKVKLWKSYWLVGELLNAVILLVIFNLEIYVFNNNNSISQIPFLTLVILHYYLKLLFFYGLYLFLLGFGDLQKIIKEILFG